MYILIPKKSKRRLGLFFRIYSSAAFFSYNLLARLGVSTEFPRTLTMEAIVVLFWRKLAVWETRAVMQKYVILNKTLLLGLRQEMHLSFHWQWNDTPRTSSHLWCEKSMCETERPNYCLGRVAYVISIKTRYRFMRNWINSCNWYSWWNRKSFNIMHQLIWYQIINPYIY